MSKEARVATVYFETLAASSRETAGVIQQYILAGNKRTEAQDFSFTIQKIVEIAVKAISPGARLRLSPKRRLPSGSANQPPGPSRGMPPSEEE
ncbi:MAG: DUF2254 family protein [Kiritimatiellia bacterium]